MKDLVDPDTLRTKKYGWTKSVSVNRKGTDLNHETNLFNVRFGLKDEKVIAPKDPHIEAGTDTRNKCYGDWNVST